MSLDNGIVYDDFQGSKFPDLAVLYPEEFKLIHDHAELVTIQAGEPAIVEGQEGGCLYLVKSGLLRVVKQHDGSMYEIAPISSGDVFGEASILFQTKAGAEVRAMDDCELYAIPSHVIQELFASNERFLRATTQLAEKRSAASALAVNPIFSTLPMAVREVVLFNAKFISLNAGEFLVAEGDKEARHMFVILSGEVDVFKEHPYRHGEEIKLGRLSSGDEAGEITVVTGQPHMATVIAVNQVRTLAIKNASVVAWAERYSDFAYALYGLVYRKLRESSEILKAEVDEEEAKKLTLKMMPSLEAFKAEHQL